MNITPIRSDRIYSRMASAANETSDMIGENKIGMWVTITPTEEIMKETEDFWI